MTTQVTVPTRHRFTVDEYHEMVRAGIIAEDARVELLDGEVIDMPPIGPVHAGGVKRTSELFHDRFRDVAMVAAQDPIALGEYGEPQPDVALLRRRDDFYTSGHPAPSDIFLLVEVADSSLEHDRVRKALQYAQAGILDYWVEDLVEHTLVVHRDPTPEGYRTVQTLRRGDAIAPLAFPDRVLAVTDLVGTA
jgi:Uma2 family endonuclease